ncbi:shikimate kinase [Chlorobium sp. N1]|uniref:shikimate kinase n=1 Tax=Chlorobium sp. N1 TaxID=2491138 RepID=UPI00103E64A6|nr:shikimate kinase [Chlorobium sp. N1]TCD48577.1 shikimate kinase [Chlorobium sp. N1]
MERAVEQKEHSLIFLTGFSGSGKSTIGPLLANSLGYEFLDVDQEVERRTGKSITAIFSDEGEAAFRELELQAIRSVAGEREKVVSLGGGALEYDPSHEFISRAGTLVYLKSSPSSLARRLVNKRDRPLLRAEGGRRHSREELEEKIRLILEEREPRYLQAAVTVHTDQKRIGSTVEELTRKIERLVRKASAADAQHQQQQK